MRIVDLLKKESIDLHASVKTKAEAIDHLVDLMEKAVISKTRRRINSASSLVKKKAAPVLAKALLFPMQKRMQLRLQAWLR